MNSLRPSWVLAPGTKRDKCWVGSWTALRCCRDLSPGAGHWMGTDRAGYSDHTGPPPPGLGLDPRRVKAIQDVISFLSELRVAFVLRSFSATASLT